jgi:hypothetical protein
MFEGAQRNKTVYLRRWLLQWMFIHIFMCLRFFNYLSMFTFSLFLRGRGKLVRTIGQTIKRDIDFNGLSLDLIHDDRTLWRCRCLIHIYCRLLQLEKNLVLVIVFYQFVINPMICIGLESAK